MGIQSVTNSGACTELYQLGLQVVLHFSCQTAPPPARDWLQGLSESRLESSSIAAH